MNNSLEVCLIGLALSTGVAPSSVAQSAAQALRKGVSVQMAVTHSAVPMPDAERENALIVSVTSDGTVYLGIEPLPLAALTDKLKSILANQRERKIYIKADARAPYANVADVLNATRAGGVEAPILLTAQRESAKPETVVPPKGMEVLIGSPASSDAGPVVVEMLWSGKGEHALKIQNETIPLSALNSRLNQLFENSRSREVLLRPKRAVSFAEVAAVTDVCRSAGAKVFLLPGEK